MVALRYKPCRLDQRRWSGGSTTIQILSFGSDGGLVEALLYKSCRLDQRRWSGGSTTVQILFVGSEMVVWW